MKTPQSLPNTGKKLDLTRPNNSGLQNGILASAGPTRSKIMNDLLRACDQIDIAIFSPLPEYECSPRSAENLNPVNRIISPDLISRWETGLEMLSEEYLRGNFTPGEFEQILKTLLVGVEKLEVVREQLDGDLRSELRACGEDAVLALENLRAAVEERCRILEKAFVDLGKKLDEIA
jgi:hypothetical protein